MSVPHLGHEPHSSFTGFSHEVQITQPVGSSGAAAKNKYMNKKKDMSPIINHAYEYTQTGRQAGRQAGRQTDRQTHTHTHTHTQVESS